MGAGGARSLPVRSSTLPSKGPTLSRFGSSKRAAMHKSLACESSALTAARRACSRSAEAGALTGSGCASRRDFEPRLQRLGLEQKALLLRVEIGLHGGGFGEPRLLIGQGRSEREPSALALWLACTRPKPARSEFARKLACLRRTLARLACGAARHPRTLAVRSLAARLHGCAGSRGVDLAHDFGARCWRARGHAQCKHANENELRRSIISSPPVCSAWLWLGRALSRGKRPCRA